MHSMMREGQDAYQSQQQQGNIMTGMPLETVMQSPRVPPQQPYAAAAGAVTISSGSSVMSSMGPGAWGYTPPPGGSAAATAGSVSLTSASCSPVAPGSSNMVVEAAAAEAYAQQQLELPDDVFTEAQRRVYERAERNDNVQSIDELLLNDDRRDVPELYQAESDTDDISFFPISHGAANSSGEEEDEGLRSLAASLLH